MPVNLQMDDKQLRKFLQAITVLPRVRKKRLLNDVGLMAQRTTRRKIEAGAYQAPSKWTVAKKGVNKALRGVAGKVFWQRKTDNMGIVETRDPRFSLAQHARGFTTHAGQGGPEDNVFGDWVILPPLKRPGALSPPVSQPFSWRWKTHRRPSVTPARDIIPDERQLAMASERIAEKWSRSLINESLRRAGVFTRIAP